MWWFGHARRRQMSTPMRKMDILVFSGPKFLQTSNYNNELVYWINRNNKSCSLSCKLKLIWNWKFSLLPHSFYILWYFYLMFIFYKWFYEYIVKTGVFIINNLFISINKVEFFLYQSIPKTYYKWDKQLIHLVG